MPVDLCYIVTLIITIYIFVLILRVGIQTSESRFNVKLNSIGFK